MSTPADAAPETSRPGGSIVARLALGLGVLSLLLAAFVGLVIWGGMTAFGEMVRAEQSFRQLETVRNIEAAFARYMLAEVTRRLEDGPAPADSAEADALRGALLGYRRMIGDEIATSGSDAERSAERDELVRAAALNELFDVIETEALLERRGADPAVRARVFLNQIAGDRDRIFRAILYEIGQDERHEIDDAADALRSVERQAIAAGAALGAAFLAAALYFGFSFRTGLQRPIRRLARAAEDFGHGDGSVRAPAGLPGEFSTLASRFNQMAAELSARQAALEDEVSARTAELAAANEELRRIDATRRRFFANVSHELRTPVTVLLGEAQLARRMGGDPAAMAEALARIDASGGFLRRRLDDLMRLARSEDGALELTMVGTAFPDPVVEAADLARGYAGANEVALEIEASEPVTLRADPEALRQAALALIDNAIKFSPPGGTVSITAVADDERAKVTVADQGPGFEGDEDAVLDRYAQEGTGRAAGGSGLGLAIARWIAEQHGGSIRAANRAGGGAAVTLEIPR